ncbi:hypothetical protein FRUB_01112 [Fimbriiglobus ruber]|uniref:Uncharacterized protein n=1 Tax=Fimbriiglobus ruber TaxID=1908690 RepID=A0A225E2E4_9BACT|nr:hypothetical protein FRUB_01112 [Fimbriiglobus ruber]
MLTYTVQQITSVSETTLEEGTNKPVVGATVTKLALTRRWEIKAADATGATLELSITAMRQQINRPGPADKDGKSTVDSSVLDSATPEGREQMAVYLNKPIATVKLDTQGRVVEATVVSGSADRLKAELPFRLMLPDALPGAGATWERAFVVKLDPPNGTGEKYEATQTYTYKGDNTGSAVIAVATALKTAPKDMAELPALVPFLWEGEVYFHKDSGRYAGARLTVKKEVANHQGEGTKFVYETQYTEALAEK